MQRFHSFLFFVFPLLSLLAFSSLLPSTVVAASRGITLEPRPTAPPLPLGEGTYRALIIGNDHYRDPEKRWPSLKTAINDAKAVNHLLKHDYGFSDVTFLQDATRSEVLHALADLSHRVLPNDNVLLYYAGHGYLDPDTNKGYWVPVDARGLDQTTFLRNSTIRDEMNTIAERAKHTLLISDSCFSGTLLRTGTRGIPDDTDIQRYYAKVAEKKSVQILTAGGVEFVDDNYHQSGHSPFTYFLVNELKANNRPLVTASEVSSNVEKAVANNADQTPESGVMQGAGDELGEFIFIRLDVKVKGVPKDRIKVKVRVNPDESVGGSVKTNTTTKTQATSQSTTMPAAEDKKPQVAPAAPAMFQLPTL